MKRLLLALLLALAPTQAFAVALPIANVVTTCGTLSPAYLAGRDAPLTVDTTGTLCLNGGGGGGTPGGSSGQVQYNNAGAFGGITGATTNGVTLTLVAPVLGTPASGTLTNTTGLPVSTGLSGAGTGVLTALAANVTGSGGIVLATSPTLVTPALGTPASGVLTNATGLPISTGVSGLGTGVATFLGAPSSANLAAALTDETGSGLAVFATSPTLTTPTLGAALATTINGVTIPSATDTTALLGTVQTFTAKNTFAAGTITTSQPFTVTQTWNAGGVTFTGLLENITNSASAIGSLAMDFQVGGVSALRLTGGAVTGGNATNPLYLGAGLGANDPFLASYNVGGNNGVILGSNGSNSFLVSGNLNAFLLKSTGSIQWNSAANFSASPTPDVELFRDAAGVLALRNGVNAQKLSVYNTFTDASNYERGIFDWVGSSNVLSIGTENAGTGSARNLRFLVGGLNKLDWGISNASAWTSSGGISTSAGSTMNGNGDIFALGGRAIGFTSSNSRFKSPSDGTITLLNSAETGFTALQAGGTSASFPEWKRVSATWAARLADDSADAAITAAGATLSGQLVVTAMTQSSAAQSGTVCYNSGTGAVNYDATLGCLTSSMRFKHDWRPLSGALGEVMALQAGRFLYNDPRAAGGGEQIGLNAENMLTVEPDLVGYAPDGQLLGVRYQNTVALLVAAVQEQQREIEALQRRAH